MKGKAGLVVMDEEEDEEEIEQRVVAARRRHSAGRRRVALADDDDNDDDDDGDGDDVRAAAAPTASVARRSPGAAGAGAAETVRVSSRISSRQAHKSEVWRYQHTQLLGGIDRERADIEAEDLRPGDDEYDDDGSDGDDWLVADDDDDCGDGFEAGWDRERDDAGWAEDGEDAGEPGEQEWVSCECGVRGDNGRGLHSSTSQLNLSRFLPWNSIKPPNVYHKK
jgi:hypothetical protein